MFRILFICLATTYAGENPKCEAAEFMRALQCIGGISEFVTSIDAYNLTTVEGRQKFTISCKETMDCFSDSVCLKADRLKIFLGAYCGYLTFLETDFKKCKDQFDQREESQCEKTFKAFFDNTSTELSCASLEDSLKCVKNEVIKECGDIDAARIEKYLVQMAHGLSCDDVKKMK